MTITIIKKLPSSQFWRDYFHFVLLSPPPLLYQNHLKPKKENLKLV